MKMTALGGRLVTVKVELRSENRQELTIVFKDFEATWLNLEAG
jgi:hypothetical protein